MSVENNEFIQASEDVMSLAQKPSTEVLLKLYALYKQGVEGDISGKRPGMLDIKGRKKYDSWTELKGKSVEDAQAEYIELVKSLK